MRGLLILIPAVLLLGGIFTWLFVAAVGHGQFDDLDDPPTRMLQDDD
jgi:cbb3-type cytochrome oxidase maturation protein